MKPRFFWVIGAIVAVLIAGAIVHSIQHQAVQQYQQQQNDAYCKSLWQAGQGDTPQYNTYC